MPLSENRIIIACAGSGKTTRLVTEALSDRDRRIAIVTYTNSNLREIIKKFGERNSSLPKHVDVISWFTFLLRECARPYQRAKCADKRIESVFFVNKQSAPYAKESDTKRHYFADEDLIYSDKVSKFVVKCQEDSSGALMSRLGQIYTDVFVDEFQDLAGWDLELIQMFLESHIQITLVGDPRQNIYSTNPSGKNKGYRGIKVVERLNKWQQAGLCSVKYMNGTYRCNGPICDFSNALWPGMDGMAPLWNDATEHDGVFLVSKNEVHDYIRRFNPQVLRYDKKAKTYGCEALNFGQAKGLEFERVLIVPTEPIKRYLRSGDLHHVERAKDKLHVAATRARHSVAFVFDGDSTVVPNRWEPSG